MGGAGTRDRIHGLRVTAHRRHRRAGPTRTRRARAPPRLVPLVSRRPARLVPFARAQRNGVAHLHGRLGTGRHAGGHTVAAGGRRPCGVARAGTGRGRGARHAGASIGVGGPRRSAAARADGRGACDDAASGQGAGGESRNSRRANQWWGAGSDRGDSADGRSADGRGGDLSQERIQHHDHSTAAGVGGDAGGRAAVPGRRAGAAAVCGGDACQVDADRERIASGDEGWR